MESSRIRFHLDESVSTAVVAGLRSHGIDVTTASDADLIGGTDLDHIDFARSQCRVVVAHDSDFVRHGQGGIEHAGICYCHQGKYGIGQLLQMLLLVSACYTQEEIEGRVEFL